MIEPIEFVIFLFFFFSPYKYSGNIDELTAIVPGEQIKKKVNCYLYDDTYKYIFSFKTVVGPYSFVNCRCCWNTEPNNYYNNIVFLTWQK